VLALPAVSPIAGGGYYAPIQLALDGSPTGVAAGRLFTLKVTMSSGYGGGNVTGIDWGDGTRLVLLPFFGQKCSNTGSEPPTFPLGTPEPGSTTNTYRHVYFDAGARRVDVRAGWLSSCGVQRLRGEGRADLPVTVVAGHVTANGPDDPVPVIGIDTQARSNTLHGYLSAADEDGYVRTLAVDWGDGRGRHTYTNTSRCQPPHPGWHETRQRVNFSRVFTPRRHTIRLEVVSTDCTGHQRQALSTVRTIEVTSHGFRSIGYAKYVPHDPRHLNLDRSEPIKD
jgi:hypothetical protein